MSRISETIRKITKAWGGKTTGNGISDALSDLYNNLPFGVKTEMVEVYKSDNIEYGNHGMVYLNGMPPMVENQEYIVVLDGTTYTSVYEYIEELGVMGCYLYATDNGEVLLFMPDDVTPVIVGTQDLTSISVTTEYEVVTPLDPKFVGASGGGEFVVKGITDFTESRWEVDKTFAEAYEAYKKGKKIVLEVYADGQPDGEYAMRLTPIYVNSESMQFIIWDFKDKQWDAMRIEFNEGNNMWICSVATIEASVYSMDVS